MRACGRQTGLEKGAWGFHARANGPPLLPRRDQCDSAVQYPVSKDRGRYVVTRERKGRGLGQGT